ncbi:peptidase M24, structural domain-containing protein [Scenedesmus sp. NREL 46B-D3]|nr:peptidase M24, structural domain-containing protein [Scenedesmus sp. NREL 46B-D3]
MDRLSDLSSLSSLSSSFLEYPAERLRPGTVSPQRHVPAHITRPAYAVSATTPGQLGLSKQPEIHDAQGKAAMRAASQLAAAALQLAGGLVQPGVTTEQLDVAVHDFIIAHGAYPSPLGYHGFPKSICTSVNEVVCHGIPDSRPLQEGDIVNVDVTAYLNGHHGDTNAMFFVGQPSAAAAELVDVTQQALDAAIQLCGPDVPFKAMGMPSTALQMQ